MILYAIDLVPGVTERGTGYRKMTSPHRQPQPSISEALRQQWGVKERKARL